jgi:hypothetical protein
MDSQNLTDDVKGDTGSSARQCEDQANDQHQREVLMRTLQREHCAYCSHYCEENVYKLAEYFHSRQQPLPSLQPQLPVPIPPNGSHDGSYNTRIHCKAYAVFLSSPEQSVPIWQQKLGDDHKGGLVVWDYHVIFLVKTVMEQRHNEPSPRAADDHVGGSTLTVQSHIYDFDTRLPFACDAQSYLDECFPLPMIRKLPSKHVPVRAYYWEYVPYLLFLLNCCCSCSYFGWWSTSPIWLRFVRTGR